MFQPKYTLRVSFTGIFAFLDSALPPSETHSHADPSSKKACDSLNWETSALLYSSEVRGFTNPGTAADVIIQDPLQTVESSIVWNGTVSVSRGATDAEMPAWQEYKMFAEKQWEVFWVSAE